MSQENVALVRAACEWANRTRDFDIGDVIHPDFEWHTRQDLPDAGARKGYEGVARLRAEWVEAFEDFRIDVEDWIDGGDRVVTVSRLRGRIRGTGHEVDVPETQVWQIRDGKAAEVRAYLTRAEALKAVGLEE